ncbi:urease accessory protein UreF [Rothia halotolerans]|uniref:urease accessory protein UreF n=1 Tax=Rothia halotolerans TaxID=405770 RepID=UPI00192E2077|nr:urease accessory UreF family protein [Rothia halotolerans]
MLLADARLPTGAHAFSSSLEPALLDGLRPGEIPAYIRSRLLTVGTVEAAAALVVARDPDAGTVAEVSTALEARTPAESQRAASTLLGRGLIRLARSLAPAAAQLGPGVAGRSPHRAVAMGLIASVWGIPEAELVTAMCYDDAQTVAAAALKLEPGDPFAATGWVLGIAGTVDAVLAEALPVTGPASIPAPSSPMIDQWAQAHAARDRRLFSA